MMTTLPLTHLLRMKPYETLWSALRKQFTDPKLIQLFARYATYCGSSPLTAPATLMLIAHVEAEGVWRLEGGMAALPVAMQKLADRLGVTFKLQSSIARITMHNGNITGVIDEHDNSVACNTIVMNGDPNALATALLGKQTVGAVSATKPRNNSFSAVTWCGKIALRGRALAHHTVFFSDNYEEEFKQLSTGLAKDPTTYVCDQGVDKKQILVNAPAGLAVNEADIRHAMAKRLAACGAELDVTPADSATHTPSVFSNLYPATNGALYGKALDSWNATFLRPQARTRVPGLYLAGGATHPGPGVPMAALSGMRAAEALLQDRASMRPFRKMAIAGGT
jgi:1-hydroxycarotenoid 3,4-desaturase